MLGNVERKIVIRAAIIETFISEETFAFFAFLHFLHLDGCHKASLFLLKFHALFNGSLDSFSTSGRGCTRSCKGNAKVMQRSCKDHAKVMQEESQKRFALIKTFILGFILPLATPVGDTNIDLSGPSHVT